MGYFGAEVQLEWKLLGLIPVQLAMRMVGPLLRAKTRNQTAHPDSPDST